MGRKTKCQILAERYGGTWTYFAGTATWWNQNHSARVSHVACSVHDDPCNCSTPYVYYGPDKTEIVYW